MARKQTRLPRVGQVGAEVRKAQAERGLPVTGIWNHTDAQATKPAPKKGNEE